MTKIANTPAYQIKENIVLTDYFPGTNSETEKLETVSFRFQDVQKYLLSGLTPETGGTLRITEISYSGEGYGTASELLNALDPNYVVMRYHVVIVSVNGSKSLLKLQDITVGLGQDEVIDSDFILFPTAVGPVGNGIASIVKTGTAGLVDTYTITFTNSSTTTFEVTNGVDGADGIDGINGNTGPTGNGIESIVKTDTTGLVDTYTVTFTNSDTTTFQVTNGADGAPGADYTANLQKVITYPADFTGTNYTLTDADNNYEIIVNNGVAAVAIIVPSGLTSKIGVGFTQKGTGDVTYVASGTTINNPTGLKIKGQYYQTYLSQELATNLFYLGGNTKI